MHVMTLLSGTYELTPKSTDNDGDDGDDTFCECYNKLITCSDGFQGFVSKVLSFNLLHKTTD